MEEIEVPTEHLHEEIQEKAEEQKERWTLYVALSTAFMAVLAAVAGLLAGHHANEALIERVKASDQWNYYQAKNLKAELVASSDRLIHTLAPNTPAEDHKLDLARYERDKASIKQAAEEAEKLSEQHLGRHVPLASAVTAFQIAIAISAISLLTRRKQFWYMGLLLMLAGVGFLIAGICGYMAGLIGASNSPISGVGILSIVICASTLVLVVSPTEGMRPALVAFSLFITAIVFACATISNDNLQDLKTGQLVGASPMRQQIALIVGVAAGASVIPFVLNLLAKAYGFAGAPNVHVVAQNPLPAPQATLISALAQGVIGGKLEWNMIGIGALVGVGLILLDTMLGAMKKLRIPPLAVGIGIYLPMSATFAVVVGAVISHWYDRKARSMPDPERADRLGTLVASGLIVGESLWGVLNAGLIVGLSKDAPIGLFPEDFALAPWLGMIGFIGAIVLLYGWMLRRSAAVSTPNKA